MCYLLFISFILLMVPPTGLNQLRAIRSQEVVLTSCPVRESPPQQSPSPPPQHHPPTPTSPTPTSLHSTSTSLYPTPTPPTPQYPPTPPPSPGPLLALADCVWVKAHPKVLRDPRCWPCTVQKKLPQPRVPGVSEQAGQSSQV